MKTLKEKLYQWEQEPPAGAWEAISRDLDESAIGSTLVGKLAGAVAEVPADAWEQIRQQLDREYSIKPLPQPAAKRIWLRVAAVSAVAVIALGLWWMNKSPEPNVTASSSDRRETDSAAKKEAGPHTTFPAGEDLAEGSLLSAEEEPAVNELPRRQAGRKSAQYAIAAVDMPVRPLFSFNEESTEISDRYIVLMTPNGLIRMSKKWGSLVCCVSGEDEATDCKDQLRKWQEKLACTPAGAGGNVMDVLSLVRSLESDL